MNLSISFLFALCACESPNPISTEPVSAIQEQLQESGRINFQSAQNALTQARSEYLSISADLLRTSVDVEAFKKLNSKVLPPMQAVANSLSVLKLGEEQLRLQTDFQMLFSEISAQALNGINLNLAIYQGAIESPQSLGGTLSSQALEALSALFQATEYAERYAQQLAAFSGLLENSSSVRDSLRNQQTVIINGVVRLSEDLTEQSELIQLYQTFAQTLTRPELLARFADLARQTYGAENVAFNQTELTPVQTNPNLIQMVVSEGDGQYRLIRVQDGLLINELKQDSRGLSASDLLNQSNVVIVQERA